MSNSTASLIGVVGNLGERLSHVTQRWIPDSWVVCMILTVIALLLSVLGAGTGVDEAVLAWGGGMWALLELAMQFTIAMVAAHACVSSRPVFALLDRLARLPNPERPLQAVALVAIYSLVTGYLNWALCIVASALFVPFVCRRNPKADVRVLIASAYLGLGTVWHGGLSGSAPLILATPGNPLLEPATGPPVIDRLLPVTETLFIPFNLIYLLIIGAVALLTVVALHPRSHPYTLSREHIDSILPALPAIEQVSTTPAGRLESFRG